MDAATLKALKGSIAKWKKNAVAKHPDRFLTSIRACPLCDLFYNQDWHRNEAAEKECCTGCPVFKKTKEKRCQNTPYEKAVKTQNVWEGAFEDEYFYGGGTRVALERASNHAARAHKDALAEVKFLESLLPKPERKKT